MNKNDLKTLLGTLYLVATLVSAITVGALIIQNKIHWFFTFPLVVVDVLMFWLAMRLWDRSIQD